MPQHRKVGDLIAGSERLLRQTGDFVSDHERDGAIDRDFREVSLEFHARFGLFDSQDPVPPLSKGSEKFGERCRRVLCRLRPIYAPNCWRKMIRQSRFSTILRGKGKPSFLKLRRKFLGKLPIGAPAAGCCWLSLI